MVSICCPFLSGHCLEICMLTSQLIMIVVQLLAVVDLLISSRYNPTPANLYEIKVCWLFLSEKKQLLFALALFLDSFSKQNGHSIVLFVGNL